MHQPTAGYYSSLVWPTFIGTRLGLAIIGGLASWRMSAAAKRRWLTPWIILIGVLFICFSTTIFVLASRSWSSLAILIVNVPMVVWISYLNLKLTKFCDKCNATLFNRMNSPPIRLCPKCGAQLDTAKPLKGDWTLE
jgi:hypothetical protein